MLHDKGGGGDRLATELEYELYEDCVRLERRNAALLGALEGMEAMSPAQLGWWKEIHGVDGHQHLIMKDGCPYCRARAAIKEARPEGEGK